VTSTATPNCRTAAPASHPQPTYFLSPRAPGEGRSPTVSATYPARGRARGGEVCGPGVALAPRVAERDREGGTIRHRASHRRNLIRLNLGPLVGVGRPRRRVAPGRKPPRFSPGAYGLHHRSSSERGSPDGRRGQRLPSGPQVTGSSGLV
jgi:hypothetical protein